MALLDGLRRGRAFWAIPWPCVHEFLAIVTHPRIFKDPTPLAVAFDAIDSWQAYENLQLLSESEGYLDKLRPAQRPAQLVETTLALTQQLHALIGLPRVAGPACTRERRRRPESPRQMTDGKPPVAG